MAQKDDKGNLHADSNGRFISKEEQEAKREEAEKIYNSDPNTKDNEGIEDSKSPSIDDFFGEEFKGQKGKDAVEKLLKEKRGHIKAAFTRTEVGDIALVWGDKNGGLQHTILKRDRLRDQGIGQISGIDMAKKIPDIIENGVFNQDEKGRMNIDFNEYRVALKPEYFNHKINWIVTAMEILQKKKPNG